MNLIQDTIIANAMLDNLNIDNTIAKCALNFAVLGLLEVTRAQIPSIKDYVLSLFKKKYPSIHLSSIYDSRDVMSYSYKTWVVFYTKHITNSNNIALKETLIINSATNITESKWLPDQSHTFQIMEDVWFTYWSESIKILRNGKEDHDCINHIKIFTKKGDIQKILKINKKMTADYMKTQEKELNKGSYLYELTGFRDNRINWRKKSFQSFQSMKHIWFEEKELFLRNYKKFLTSKEEYKRKGIPWTFSCLLYGEPGCGKTSLIKSIINEDKYYNITSHIMIVPLNLVIDSSMFSTIMLDQYIDRDIIPYEQRIYIFEDFDACRSGSIFKKRDLNDTNCVFDGSDDSDDSGLLDDSKMTSKNKKKISCDLSLSDVLNVLDGLVERNGQRTFWTTNRKVNDYFDPAFIRPGRMNMLIKFTKCTKLGIQYLLEDYYESKVNIDDLNKIDDYIWSPAKLKQMCYENDTLEQCIKILQ